MAAFAYSAGQRAAKVAFLGELYDKHIKGDVGPLASGIFTKNPLLAGGVGGLGQALDSAPGESRLLSSLGVAGGAGIANAVASPIAKVIANVVAKATGAPPVVEDLLSALPTSLAQTAGARGGRHAARKLDQFMKDKKEKAP